MSPNEATKELRPADLASQLFDAAILQYKNPREAAQQVIAFLRDSLVYAISATTQGSEEARKGLLKTIGETVVNAGSPPAAPAPATPTP